VKRRPRERIYIIPTAAGVCFAALLLALFAAGYAVQGLGGPAQILVIALLVAGIVVLFETNDNLRTLEAEVQPVTPAEAGTDALLRVTVTNRGRRPRLGLRLRGRRGWRSVGRADIPLLAPGATATIELEWPAGARGLQPAPPLWLSSTYPAGLCFAWKSFPGRMHIPVYPRGRSWRELPGGGADRGAGDVAGHRPYAPGDPPSRVDWKILAKSGRLAVRDLEDAGRIAIAWEDTDFLPSAEDRLAQMSAWLDECAGRGARFEFRLGPSILNERSLDACRIALAAHPATP
jgi:uncharacterized protein (DUF58 family)